MSSLSDGRRLPVNPVSESSEWRKAAFAEVLKHRFYHVWLEDDITRTRRRTSSHVRFSVVSDITAENNNQDEVPAQTAVNSKVRPP